MTAIARKLRREPTLAEAHLWQRLRASQLGFRFTRQHPIGPFVVDFVCRRKKLVIEVDGGQHADSGAEVNRTRVIEAYGYRILRFWNLDVLQNTDGVIQEIVWAIDNASNQASSEGSSLRY